MNNSLTGARFARKESSSGVIKKFQAETRRRATILSCARKAETNGRNLFIRDLAGANSRV